MAHALLLSYVGNPSKSASTLLQNDHIVAWFAHTRARAGGTCKRAHIRCTGCMHNAGTSASKGWHEGCLQGIVHM